MKVGDILKIIEHKRCKNGVRQRITIGEIVAMDNKLTICRIKDGAKDWNISYSVGDLVDISKKFYLKTKDGWMKIKFTAKERVENDVQDRNRDFRHSVSKCEGKTT